MDITCVSDLHGHYPKLEGGDLLIIAGDLTARDSLDEHREFALWLSLQPYKKRIVIAGNHDNRMKEDSNEIRVCYSFWNSTKRNVTNYAEYLSDSGTEFEGLKIWGSPWRKTFPNMNPLCKAFTVDTEEELSEKWEMIPDDTNILITHTPPFGILDQVVDTSCGCGCKDSVGSHSLLLKSASLKNLKLFCFGHIHESYGHVNRELSEKVSKQIPCDGYSMPQIVNASHVNERYEAVNKPIRVIL